MEGRLGALAESARKNPAILQEIVASPDAIASRFSLSFAEAEALRSNNFNAFGSLLGVSRSARASKHDDAYLSC